MKKTKLTNLEKRVTVDLLISCEEIFEYDNDMECYTDHGNFIHSFETIEEVKAIKRAWHKLLKM